MRESIKNRTDLEILKVEYDATLTKMDFWAQKWNEAQNRIQELEATVRTLTRLNEPEKATIFGGGRGMSTLAPSARSAERRLAAASPAIQRPDADAAAIREPGRPREGARLSETTDLLGVDSPAVERSAAGELVGEWPA